MNAIAKNAKNLVGWIDQRFPLMSIWNEHIAQYYAPKNFNIWYYFGIFSMVMFVNQILTGIWLTMNYKPSAIDAFFICGIYNARRRLGLVNQIYAFNWGLLFLHCNLFTYVSCAYVRLIQKTKRVNLDSRYVPVFNLNG